MSDETRQLRVLVVEDDPVVRRAVCQMIESAHHHTVEASGVVEAVKRFRAERPDIVISDYGLGDGTAFDLLARLPEIDASVPVVVITGQGTIDLAVSAMKRGAYHFITKPFRLADLTRLIDRALAEKDGHGEELDPFEGDSLEVRRLGSAAQRVASAPGPVLIEGETGTGKALIAHWIHRHSPRAAGPFVTVNCSGLAPEQSDADLFGRHKGPGGASAHRGLVERANKGTLFFDEIGDLALSVQGKLLEFIESGRLSRPGAAGPRSIDVRVIACSQRSLERRVAEGAFREDLYFRLARLLLHVPPLRQRLDDLPFLARSILGSVPHARAGVALDAAALERLRQHAWRGNIRELRNVLERAVLHAEDATIGVADLRLDSASAEPHASGDAVATLADLERMHIERVLVSTGYDVPEAARRLGIPRSTLYQRIREYRIALRPR